MTVSIGVDDEGVLRVRIDPHDGSCGGAHDVLVMATPVKRLLPSEPRVHVTLTWGPSAFLSVRGSGEFYQALEAGIKIALALETAQSVAEASRMADDMAAMLKSAAP